MTDGGVQESVTKDERMTEEGSSRLDDDGAARANG